MYWFLRITFPSNSGSINQRSAPDFLPTLMSPAPISETHYDFPLRNACEPQSYTEGPLVCVCEGPCGDCSSCNRCNPGRRTPRLPLPGTVSPLKPLASEPTTSRAYGTSVSSSELEEHGHDLVNGPENETRGLLSPRGPTRCMCHYESHENAGNKKARIKLIIACLIALAFTLAEVTG